MAQPFSEMEQAYNFMLAGKATVTIASRKSGKRYTYKVTQAKDKPGLYFVSLLIGPDNTQDYAYIGILQHDVFRTTAKSAFSMNEEPVKAFNWTWERMFAFKAIPPEVEIWHEGKCGRCGRSLTVPESIEAGIGPECALKGSR